MSLPGALEGCDVCVCAGSGGVGKTTTAAALALGAAAQGRKVAVVTIDPARRLANALGLAHLGNTPVRVSPERLALAGPAVEGELWAMMLDPKRTFDELIERLAPDARTRDEILANRIYREVSTAVAGSQEFTAVAKLHELHRDHDFDLVVLDTPPSRNALDFLDAPSRLTGFLEGRALQAFLRPTGLAARVMGRGTGVAFAVLRRLTGIDLLRDLTTFFGALSGLLDGFRERAADVDRLLRDPGTRFLIVTSPEPEPVEEAIYFRERLRVAGMPFGGSIVNRTVTVGDRPRDRAALRAELDAALGDERLAQQVLDAEEARRRRAERDARAVARLTRALGAAPLVCVPRLGGDVHDIEGLGRVAEHLFGSRRAEGAGAQSP